MQNLCLPTSSNVPKNPPAPLLLPTATVRPAIPVTTLQEPSPRQDQPKCPLCTTQVYQYFLNGKQAVVMCSDTKCPYPFNLPTARLMLENVVPIPAVTTLGIAFNRPA